MVEAEAEQSHVPPRHWLLIRCTFQVVDPAALPPLFTDPLIAPSFIKGYETFLLISQRPVAAVASRKQAQPLVRSIAQSSRAPANHEVQFLRN